jgi:hypothetical protein
MTGGSEMLSKNGFVKKVLLYCLIMLSTNSYVFSQTPVLTVTTIVVSISSKTVVIDLKNNKKELELTKRTKYFDAKGNRISWNKFKPGDMVQVYTNMDSDEVVQIRKGGGVSVGGYLN